MSDEQPPPIHILKRGIAVTREEKTGVIFEKKDLWILIRKIKNIKNTPHWTNNLNLAYFCFGIFLSTLVGILLSGNFWSLNNINQLLLSLILFMSILLTIFFYYFDHKSNEEKHDQVKDILWTINYYTKDQNISNIEKLCEE